MNDPEHRSDCNDRLPPCEAARPALIVYGRNIGTLLTVCADNHCPVHDPRQASDRAANPRPVLAEPTTDESEEQTAARKADYEQRQEEYRAEQERKEAVRQQEQQRRDKEEEERQELRARQQKKRAAIFGRIVNNAPSVFSAAHHRVLLRALVNMDPYSLYDLHTAGLKLKAAVHEFLRRAGPWSRPARLNANAT